MLDVLSGLAVVPGEYDFNADMMRREAARLRNRYIWGEQFRDASFENYIAQTEERQQALAAVREFVDGKHRWLILSGTPGTGKTHLLVAAFYALCDICLGSRPWFAVNLFSGLENRIKYGVPDHGCGFQQPQLPYHAAEALMPSPVVILDDIGVGNISHQTAEIIFDFMYLRKRRLLAATNLTAAQLEKTIGARAWDRMQECATRIPMAWDSYRGKNR